MNNSAWQCCPVCSSAGIDFFFQMEDVPVFCNVLYRTAEEAQKAARGTIRLGICRRCTHIFNYAFEPDRVAYTPAYDNSLHYSPHFQQFAEGLAAELIERYDIRNKTVLDIGCGKGDFLRLMVKRGDNRGIGFDASYEADTSEGGERITIIRDFYSTAHTHPPVDLYTCRHVLEHLPNPSHLLRDVHISMQSTPGAILYVEVPNALWTLERGGIWDVIYEHCSYFTDTSLQQLLKQCGFAVLRMDESFGGQYIAAECALQNAPMQPQAEACGNVTRLADLAHAFSDEYLRKVREWKTTLDHSRQEQKHLVVWGAGSKGVTFLNIVDTMQCIEHIVDVNPRKQGRYTPCTSRLVLAPDQLRHIKPDGIVVMNPVYADEIRSTLDGLGLTPEILFA